MVEQNLENNGQIKQYNLDAAPPGSAPVPEISASQESNRIRDCDGGRTSRFRHPYTLISSHLSSAVGCEKANKAVLMALQSGRAPR